MGVKGRRVHMIEEMSDTIISFQRGKNTKNVICKLLRFSFSSFVWFKRDFSKKPAKNLLVNFPATRLKIFWRVSWKNSPLVCL